MTNRVGIFQRQRHSQIKASSKAKVIQDVKTNQRVHRGYNQLRQCPKETAPISDEEFAV